MISVLTVSEYVVGSPSKGGTSLSERERGGEEMEGGVIYDYYILLVSVQSTTNPFSSKLMIILIGEQTGLFTILNYKQQHE